MTNKLGEIQSYFESPLISQSFLKNFLSGQPRSIYRSKEAQLYYEEKKHYIVGSLIDFLVTLQEEDIHQTYYIDDIINKPSEKIMSIIHQLYDEGREFNQDNIVEVCRLQEYQNRYTADGLYKAISPYEEYYNALHVVNGRQIIDVEEWELSQKAATAILEGKFTKHIIDNPHNIFQCAIYVDGYKSLIDVLYINHDTQEFRVIDIKSTMDYLESFNIFKYRYDFQLAFYNDNVQKLYPNYTSLPPIIIAVSKKEVEYAEPFLLLNDVIEVGRKGGKLREKGEILGYQQCIEHYEYHIQNNNMFNRNLESTGFNILTNVE